MVRLQAALLLLSGCCGASTPSSISVDAASDAAADHLSLLQKRVSATRSSADVPEPKTMLAQFADEDLHLRIEPHPRRAWRRSQGLPVARKHPGHVGRQNVASLYSGAKAGSRRAGKLAKEEQHSTWAAQAERVAEQAKSEETAKATTEVSQAARLADLADIQSLLTEGAQASKAAKEQASKMWRWDPEDKETKEARGSKQHEELAAESAFQAEMKAEDAYAEETAANASGNSTVTGANVSGNSTGPATVQQALLSEETSPASIQQAHLTEVRGNATTSSQANNTASSSLTSDAVLSLSAGTVQSAGAQVDDALESGPTANASHVASLADQDQSTAGDAVSRPISSNNSTEASAVVVVANAIANATVVLADAPQAQPSEVPSSTDETVTSKVEVLLHEEFKEHATSEATLQDNVSTITLSEGDAAKGDAGVNLESVSPLHESNASGAASATQERLGNASEALRPAHTGNTSATPLKTKFVFEIDGKNVSTAQALRAKNQHATFKLVHQSRAKTSVAIAPGAYYIVNAKRQKYMSTLGTNVSVVKTENTSKDEHVSGLQWRFDPIQGKNDTYHVVSVRYQKYLNTLGGPAQLWASTHPRDAAKGGPPSLEWRFQPAGPADTYYVVNEGQQKYMNALSGAVSVWRGQSLEDLGTEPGNIQWRLERVKTQEVTECELYVSAKNPGCLWTGNWSCPAQPTGSKGVAGAKGGQETIGFHCCCNFGLWAAPYAVDAVTTDARSF